MTAVTTENVLTLWERVYLENNVSVIPDSLETNAVKVSLAIEPVVR